MKIQIKNLSDFNDEYFKTLTSRELKTLKEIEGKAIKMFPENESKVYFALVLRDEEKMDYSLECIKIEWVKR
jgi:hypothetical protein